MLPSYLQTLPEEYKNLLKTPKHMKPSAVYYDELKKNEELKDNTRKSSVLYSLFKEDLFTFMTSKGELNFNIRITDIEQYLKQIEDEIELTYFRYYVFDQLENFFEEDKVPVPEFVLNKAELGQDKAMLSFNYKAVYENLNTRDLDKILNDLLKYCAEHDVCEAEEPIYISKYKILSLNVFMNKELREMMDSSTEYLKHFASTKLDVQNQMFLARSIKAKELDKSVKSINWLQEFSKN